MNYRPKVLYIAFQQFLVQIYKDAMLIILCLAPVLCGILFKYVLPIIEKIVNTYLPLSSILQPYYLLFDLLLAMVTPLMYCFAAAYVILSEIDDGISRYLAVTPVGKKGYLISRIGIPAFISFLVSIITLYCFKLTDCSFPNIIGVCVITTLLGVVTALLIVSLSANKVEGMAVSKMTGLLSLGLPAPFFMNGTVQYALFFLPSFWLSKFAKEANIIYFLIGCLESLLWIYLLYSRFDKKIK